MSDFHLTFPVVKGQYASGSLHIWYGPMSSSKTTRLTTNLGMLADLDSKFRVALINHSNDLQRTDLMESSFDGVSSHGSHFNGLSKRISVFHLETLKVFDSNYLNLYDIIGIDEGQFFPDLEDLVREWVYQKKKIVMIASLDGDFRMKPFGQVFNLIPLSQQATKLTAWCKLCRIFRYDSLSPQIAPFTARLSNVNQQVDVGGSDKYVPVCLLCHQLVDHARFLSERGETEALTLLHQLCMQNSKIKEIEIEIEIETEMEMKKEDLSEMLQSQKIDRIRNLLDLSQPVTN